MILFNFTPEKLEEIDTFSYGKTEKTVTGKTGNGKSVYGKSATSEDNTIKKKSFFKEDISFCCETQEKSSFQSILNNQKDNGSIPVFPSSD